MDDFDWNQIDPEILEAAQEMGLNKEQILQLQKNLEEGNLNGDMLDSDDEDEPLQMAQQMSKSMEDQVR